MRPLAALVCAVMLMCLAVLPGRAEKRVALVIGNSAYQSTPVLPNPKNDAADLAAALRALGFEVLLATDLNKRGMDEAFGRFARLARDADAALFFYAGHGIQFAGSNYLMPVDAKLQDEADLPYEMAKVDDVISDLSRAKNIRIVILDACRDNPMAERLRLSLPASRSAAVSRGLARIERTQGLITAFATQPGQVAADGVGARNSPFTSAILKHIATPGIEAATLFRRVAQEVNTSTAGRQLPELSISLLGEFYFAGQASIAAVPTSEAAQAWLAIKDSTSQAVLEDFIRQFGSTIYGSMARARLEELKQQQAAGGSPPARATTTPRPMPEERPGIVSGLLDGLLGRRPAADADQQVAVVAPPPVSAQVHALAIPEGFTSEQIVQRLLAAEFVIGNVKEIPREGSLLPETYKVTQGTTRAELIQSMQQAQRQVLQEVWERRAPDLPLRTPDELVVLASIVEKETARPEERVHVAAVLLNRLKQKMRLQSDPTIVYGLVGGKGSLGRPLTRSEIEQPMPYNTYVIEGLPPGPIANPGRAALEAAANPARTKELYLVADGAGGHAFAESLEQHQKNVARLRAVEPQGLRR